MDTLISIKVTPNSSKNEIVGWSGEILKIKLRATPEKGEANAALIEFLAKTWGIPKSSIHIVRGAHSRTKLLSINGDLTQIVNPVR